MIGQTISHYQILEKLGEGGMGVVYKAQDITLDRLVALKFLPAHLSASEQDKSRFVQEAKAAASLNHPNICTIHGIEESEDPEGARQIFIAMEFVDGQTLRDKTRSVGAIHESPLQMKQAIEIGIQLADGLAAAHEKGIVHRDVKPENIMLQKDGRVRIMDFGLAKLKSASRLTKVGSTVGTTGYMSPEQVQGQESDHRSDIFSLGVILYEMFAGQSPFKGAHETAINYEIVNVDPDPISSVKPEFPPELDAVVLECMAKDVTERYQSVAEVGKELRRYKRESSRTRVSRVSSIRPAGISSQPSEGSRPEDGGQAQPSEGSGATYVERLRGAGLLWMGMAALFLITTVLLFLSGLSHTGSLGAEIVRVVIPLPEKHRLSETNGGGHLALSPDGRKIAFVAVDSAGRPALWVRPLSSLSAAMLPATAGALFPFWSPDSRYIGFFADGKLKKIEAAGGPTFTICDIVSPRGGSWSAKGFIVFPADQLGGLSKVSEAGGTPLPITQLDSTRNEQTHRWPWFLPDGEHFLYLARTTASGSGSEMDAISVASLDGKLNKHLIQGISNIAFANGYVLYMRENSLMAHRFDAGRLEFEGEPVPIAGSVEFSSRYSVATFSVSQTGILVYEDQNVSLTPELAIADVRGKKVTSLGNPEIFTTARLSNDGQRIAMDLYDVSARNADIWVYEINRRVPSRFTFDSFVDMVPLWSPDGSRLVFSSNRKGTHNLYEKVSSGAANEQLLVESNRTKIATDWSYDRKFILYHSTGDPKTKSDVWYLPMAGDRKPVPLLQSEYNELNARLSPDARWFAYQSDESGKYEIYVRPFPSADAKWQVSTGGGVVPRWNSNGKEIYYFNSGKIMAAELSVARATFVPGTVREYFDPSSIGGATIRDLSRDGQKVLVSISRGTRASVPITLVMNWDAELKRK